MPGIAGLITKMPRERAEQQLLRMIGSLCHEPFYETGTWVDESLGVYVGWAVQRNSFSDGMPLCNEHKDVCLVFSGEEYPEPGTARRLQQSGHRLSAGGPSYLVHLYEPESYYRGLRDVFSRNLPRYFNGHQRIGMSLTGGLDTRMMMAWLKPSPGSLPCYSFGGKFRECQDVTVARRVAHACGQSHQVIPVGEEFLSRFPQYAERTAYLTDGCADVSRSPDLYVNEQAAKIAPVRMTGNYGGEVLRRVRAFKPEAPMPELFEAELLSQVRVAKQTYGGLAQGHPLSFAVFRQAPWHHYGLLALEQTQLSLRSPYLDNDLI